MDIKTPDLSKCVITQDNKQNKQQLRELWELVFPEDSKAYLDFYFERVYLHNTVFVALQGERPIGMLHMNPYALDGQRIYYIVGVATHPDFRGRGIMGKMMEAGIDMARAEGVKTLLLLPADERFYLSFGFKFVSSQYNTTILSDHYENMLRGGNREEHYSSVLTKETFIQVMQDLGSDGGNGRRMRESEPLWTDAYLDRLYEEITCENGHVGVIKGCVVVYYLEDDLDLRNYYLRTFEGEHDREETIETICLTLLSLAKGRPLVFHEVNHVVLASFFAYVKENSYDFRPYMMQLKLADIDASEVYFNEVI